MIRPSARSRGGLLVLAGALSLEACTESAVEPVSAELHARGTPVDTSLEDGTRITLSRADLAFGPFYACAGAQAGQSCGTALVEWREARVVDVLAESSVTLGLLEGYSGRALSYMHDCGIVSLLTQEAPLVLPAATDLNGHSLEIEGIAVVPVAGAPSIPFRIELMIASSRLGDRGEPVVRSSPGQFDAEIGPRTSTVTASFDAAAWVAELDQSAFWQDASCVPDGPPVACAGTVSQDCSTGESVDCALRGEVCVPQRGCRAFVLHDAESAAGRTVAQAITLAAGLKIEVE